MGNAADRYHRIPLHGADYSQRRMLRLARALCGAASLAFLSAVVVGGPSAFPTQTKSVRRRAIDFATLAKGVEEPAVDALASVEAPAGTKQPEKKQEIGAYSVSAGSSGQIDYSVIVAEWGCQWLNSSIVERIERLTGKKAHRYLRRNIYYAHRDLERILNRYEQGIPFYLYTGRGPSSDALHLGHLVPFIFNKWLQEVFDVPLVIQITDDEKFWAKDLSWDKARQLARENIKDIMAVGFDPAKTFIFIDSIYISALYPVAARVAKHFTASQVKASFGFTDSTNTGLHWYPAMQAAPAFAETFPQIFTNKTKWKDIGVIIPCAIDQDPFFRLTRDVAHKLKFQKPSTMYSKFFPGLLGHGTKMSSSDLNWKESTIFVTDTPKQIEKKVKTHAFSGGGLTKELHEQHGANLTVDVPWAWLQYLMEDDERLEEIGRQYQNGTMFSGEIKKILTEEIVKVTSSLQEARAKITEEDVDNIMNPIFAERKPPWKFEF